MPRGIARVVPTIAAHVLGCLMALGHALPARAAYDAVPGELIVRYRTGAGLARRASALAAVPGARVLHRLDLIGADRVSFSGLSTEAAIARLAANPNVLYAEPNYTVSASLTPNDSAFTQLWGLSNTGQGGAFAGDDIDALRAWDLFTGDPELKVGVIDTGIDYNHPDLAPNMWTNPGEIADNFIDDDGNGYVDDVHGFDVLNYDGDPMDDHFHGTHVAGTIGAAGNNGHGVSGVNWRCRLVAIKFLDASGNGNEANAIAALQYAIAVGVRVTNNSWGNMGGGQALLDAINAAGAAGQLAVFAAGNNGWNMDGVPVYPPSYLAPCMITVTATDGRDLRPTWSNFGPSVVHLGAPGAAVYSCKPGGLYQSLNGTSMAAPHVTGTIALAMGMYPRASAARIRQLILDNTEPIASMAGKTVTGGRLNAYLALSHGDLIPPSGITDLTLAGADTSTLALSWTWPGDDGASGAATSFELRYSTAPIDLANFSAALPAVAPLPEVAGTPASLTLTGLTSATPYWVAARAVDDFGNPGPLSNVLQASTLAPATDVKGPRVEPDRLRLAGENPGRASARFELRLAAARAVDARVLDLAGREITTLLHGPLGAGVHALGWDGHAGATVVPGVYFLRVRTDGRTLVQRFAIVR